VCGHVFTHREEAMKIKYIRYLPLVLILGSLIALGQTYTPPKFDAPKVGTLKKGKLKKANWEKSTDYQYQNSDPNDNKRELASDVDLKNEKKAKVRGPSSLIEAQKAERKEIYRDPLKLRMWQYDEKQ
jgi:hypothetical protein